MHLLNIGLARTGNSNIGVGTALREIEASGFTIFAHAVHHSDTEITVVAEGTFKHPVLTKHNANVAYNLACRLGQDCVAVYDLNTQTGALHGPRAAAWGEFNPEFFLMLDGTRLPSPLQVAA